MKLIINCECGKQIVFTEIKNEYKCIHCGRIYEKIWIDAKTGEYTFKIKGK